MVARSFFARPSHGINFSSVLLRPPHLQVRILDQESATRAKTRVLIEFYDKVCMCALNRCRRLVRLATSSGGQSPTAGTLIDLRGVHTTSLHHAGAGRGLRQWRHPRSFIFSCAGLFALFAARAVALDHLHAGVVFVRSRKQRSSFPPPVDLRPRNAPWIRASLPRARRCPFPLRCVVHPRFRTSDGRRLGSTPTSSRRR